MDIKQTEARISVITTALIEHRLGDALTALSALSEELAPTQFSESLERLREEYTMMLRYTRQGMADPDRNHIYARFMQRAAALSDSVSRTVMLSDTTSYYTRVAKRAGNIHTQTFHTDSSDEEPTLESLFDCIYASAPFGRNEYEHYAALIGNEAAPKSQRLTLAAALLLSLMHVFDARKVMLLADGVFSPCMEFRARSIVGTALASYVHRDRIRQLPELNARLQMLCDDKSFSTALRIVQLQLLLSLGTRHDSKQMSENIFPTMMKAAKKFTDRKGFNIAQIREEADFNPEWTADGKKSPLFEAMQKVMGMQEQGVDMFFSTFEHTMRFQSHFYEASHWFIPFAYNRRMFAGRGEKLKQLDIMFAGKPSGDTERYATALMLLQMPDEQLNAMIASVGQLKENGTNETEGVDARHNNTKSDDPDEPLRIAVRLYVHDLYRFFNLFRNRNELHNPFDSDLDLSVVDAFSELLRKPKSLINFGNFCFGRGEWKRATTFFEELPEEERDAETYEKIGYCKIKLGEHNVATHYFECANLLKPESPWTLRQMAFTSMQCDKLPQAITSLLELERLRPDELQTTLMLADCYLRTDEGEKAMPLLHKAYYLQADSRTTRALAAGLLNTKRYSEAQSLFEKILADNPDAADYRNAAHAAWLDDNVEKAVNLYRKALECSGETEAPSNFFATDAKLLQKADKTELDLLLMRDIINTKESEV